MDDRPRVDTHNPKDTQTSQQTDTPTDAQVDKHRSREKYGCKGKSRATEVVGSEEGRRVLGVRHWDVDEEALGDDVDGQGVNGDADDADDPMDMDVGGPT